MQLVGARKWFIQRPFFSERQLPTVLLSGVLASLASGLIINYAHRNIEDLALLLHNETSMFALMGSLLLIGMVVAAASTLFSIRKYLKMSLTNCIN
jgi:cell division transport system permease protein